MNHLFGIMIPIFRILAEIILPLGPFIFAYFDRWGKKIIYEISKIYTTQENLNDLLKIFEDKKNNPLVIEEKGLQQFFWYLTFF